MRILLIWILLLESIATGCQNSDLDRKPQAGEASPLPTTEAARPENSASSSSPATTQTPQSLPRIAKKPQASTKSETAPSPRSTKRVAAIPQNPDSSQQSCQIDAYVIDKDPKGLNVRSGPGNDYKVIDNLPTTTIGVIVNLTASQGDWVQISKAQSPQKIEFQGSGWVYAPLLGTSTRGYATKSVSLYPSATTQSKSIGRLPSQRGVKLLSCDRSWALVEYEGAKGWIAPDAQCPNPLTTCP